MTRSCVWCFFCNRSFKDEVRLIEHQKMNHFRCPVCHKVRSTTKDLTNHMLSVHKELLERVPNAVEGRDSPCNAVFGMKGVPVHVYVAWMTSIDPGFQERAKEVSLDGAVFANDATRYAVMSHMASAANVTFGHYNRFQRANVQVNQGLGTVLTARGFVDALGRDDRRAGADDPADAQRKYDIAMRRAREFLDNALERTMQQCRERVEREKSRETMHFTPVDGLCVFEMRARDVAGRGK